MSIRFAKSEDYWRKTFARQYSTRYESLEFESLRCLGQGSITFARGITAIVGGNGVGKSTLVSAVAEVLRDAGAVLPSEGKARLGGSALSASIIEGDSSRTITIHQDASGNRLIGGDTLKLEARWLEPAYLAFSTRSQVIEDENFPDLLEAIDPAILSPEELSLLRYVTGKSYTKCEIFEIQDYANFDRFPYFRVEASGQQYSTESMGQGELALLITFWVIRDLPPNSILVLEEPETHVSPRSQSALMAYVASQCVQKGLWVVVTTHSPVIIAKLPRSNLRLLVRVGAAVSVVPEPRQHQVAAVLGGVFGYQGVLLVEDEGAKQFVLSLLDELDPDLARQFEIVVGGSDGEVIDAVRAFPKTRRWLSVVAALDGDRRGSEIGQANWPVIFLPGVHSPEILLKEALEAASANEDLAELTHRATHTITAARNAADNLDEHDWLIALGNQLGLSEMEMMRALVRLWLRGNGAQADARQFVSDLAASLNGN